MIKQLSIYILSFTLVSIIGFYSHKAIMSQLAILPVISLKHNYLFHGGFSLLLCANLLFLSEKEKFRDQLGFLYLVSVGLKIVLFCIVFNKEIFTNVSFTQQESVNLLIPMIVTLVLEVFFISKLLKNLPPLKNTK